MTFNYLWGHTLFNEKFEKFIMLAFIEVFIKTGSEMNMLKRKKAKNSESRNNGITESQGWITELSRPGFSIKT